MTEKSVWTKANLQRLLAAMKTSIPEEVRIAPYTKGLEAMDWEKVAFPPFSPEKCQQKWGEILHQMRKIRTLTELIVEADDVFSNPARMPELRKLYKKLSKPKCTTGKRKRLSAHTPCQVEEWTEDQDEVYLPPKPPCGFYQGSNTFDASTGDLIYILIKRSGYDLFYREQLSSMVNVLKRDQIKVCAQRWRDLTDRQRDEYSIRSGELKGEYLAKLDECLTTLDVEEEPWIPKSHGIKRPKVFKRELKLAEKFPDEPTMPPVAAHLVFLNDQMKLLKKKFPNSRERFRKVCTTWKELSNKEKKTYIHKVNKNVEKYSKELQKWFQTLKPEEQEDYLTRNPNKHKYLTKKVEIEREENVYRPSDSEDEDIEDSGSDEEEDDLDCDENEEEEEEEEDDIMFERW